MRGFGVERVDGVVDGSGNLGESGGRRGGGGKLMEERRKEKVKRIDRFLSFFFFFSFLLCLLMFFQYFSLGGRRPSLIIQPVDHISLLNISLPLFPLTKGPCGPQLPEQTEISFSFATESKRERGKRERGKRERERNHEE